MAYAFGSVKTQSKQLNNKSSNLFIKVNFMKHFYIFHDGYKKWVSAVKLGVGGNFWVATAKSGLEPLTENKIRSSELSPLRCAICAKNLNQISLILSM